MATKVASARGSERSALQAEPAQVPAAGARGPPAHRGRRGATRTHSGRATARKTVETAPQRIINTVTFARNVTFIELHLLEMSHKYSYTCLKCRIDTVTLARNVA